MIPYLHNLDYITVLHEFLERYPAEHEQGKLLHSQSKQCKYHVHKHVFFWFMKLLRRAYFFSFFGLDVYPRFSKSLQNKFTDEFSQRCKFFCVFRKMRANCAQIAIAIANFCDWPKFGLTINVSFYLRFKLFDRFLRSLKIVKNRKLWDSHKL